MWRIVVFIVLVVVLAVVVFGIAGVLLLAMSLRGIQTVSTDEPSLSSSLSFVWREVAAE